MYWTLDSIGQCHDAKVKQINNGGDHSSFYIDLNDPMDVNTDTYFNGSIIEAKNFPEGSEERKILESQKERGDRRIQLARGWKRKWLV